MDETHARSANFVIIFYISGQTVSKTELGKFVKSSVTQL